MPNNRISQSPPSEIILLATAIIAVIVGIYLRLKGLEKAPFTIDEYFIAESVNNIIGKGIPEFDCGGLYTRGIIYQYILAPLFIYGSDNELSARLVTVTSSILAAPALYLLAKRVSGKTVAYSVIILFFLSVWQIEFSRFARMYAPFQMLFLWYLFFLHKWIFQNDKSGKIWCYIISLLSIFVYEGGVFLVLFNFLPSLIKTRHFKTSNIFISTGILAITYVYLTANFRFPDAEIIAGTAKSLIIIPPILAETLHYSSVWFIFYVTLSLTLLYAAATLIKKLYAEQGDNTITYKAILIVTISLLALLNTYALIIYTVILALALNWISIKEILSQKYLLVVFAIILMFGYWLSYGFLTYDWIHAIDAEKQADTKQLFIALFKYPDIYNKTISIFFQTMPMFTALCALILFAGVIDAHLSDKKSRQSQQFLFAVAFILILLISMLKQPYISTRYFFFLYPVVLLLITLTFYNIIKRLNLKHQSVILIPVLAFMFISEDYIFNHYINIDGDDITYRTTYNDKMENHLYARWDFRSPAKFINENSTAEDIIISTTYVTPYYLNQLNYFYHDRNRHDYDIIAGCNGNKSLWVDAKLISHPEQLLPILNKTTNTVWLIAKSSQYKWLSPVEEKINTEFASNIVYTSVDGNLNVYRFSGIKHD